MWYNEFTKQKEGFFMKKTLIMVLALVLVLCFGASSALAAGKLETKQENFHFVTSYWNYGYAFAKVENVGDKAIDVNAGVLELYDEAGDVLNSTDWISDYAKTLQPGEYTYVQMYCEVEEEGAVATDYMLTVTGKSDNEASTLRLPCETDLELGVTDGWWEYNYMYAVVTNNTDKPVYDISVVMALLDAEGNIIYMADDFMYNERALMPGSSMIIRKDIESGFMEYFEANSITPASVDAIAYVNED